MGRDHVDAVLLEAVIEPIAVLRAIAIANEMLGFRLEHGEVETELHQGDFMMIRGVCPERKRHPMAVHNRPVLSGFTAVNSTSEFMKDLKVEVLDRRLARGFYRWPIAWRVTWAGRQGSAVLTLKQVSRTSIWNWAIGGFSMVMGEGELDYAGKKQPVYGLAELIM